jgi:imidazolonepropionase-like amidohydrolase
VVAITGGYVVPVVGEPIPGGTVVVENGIISQVGHGIRVPKGATVIDATGKWVLPGFIEAHGHVGIHEEANGSAGNDTNEMTNPNMAAARAIDAIDIEDEGFRDALSGGITSIVVKPGSGNPIGGLTVAIKTWGGRTIDEQLISNSVSVARRKPEAGLRRQRQDAVDQDGRGTRHPPGVRGCPPLCGSAGVRGEQG